MTYPIHLVGDVAQHDGSTNITAVKNAIAADTVVCIRRVTVDRGRRQRVRSRTVTNETAFIVHARLSTRRRVQTTLSSPMARVDRDPLKGVL